MRKEHSRLQGEQAANIAAAEKKAAALAREEAAPGIPLGFNPIRYSSPRLHVGLYRLTHSQRSLKTLCIMHTWGLQGCLLNPMALGISHWPHLSIACMHIAGL